MGIFPRSMRWASRFSRVWQSAAWSVVEAIHSQLAVWLPGRVVIELDTYQAYLPQGAGVDVVMLLRRFLKAKPTALAKKATTKKGKASEAAASTNDWSGAQIFTEGKKLSSYCVNHFNIHWKKALTKAFNGIEGGILAISFLEHLPPHRLHVIDSMRSQKQCMWDQWVIIYSQELSYLA